MGKLVLPFLIHFILWTGSSLSSPIYNTTGGEDVVADDEDSKLREDYVVEHEVSWLQAKNAVISIDLQSVSEATACQECTKEEIAYCLGNDVVNDHCCCDMRFEERLPFVPHTCYIGTQLCQPVAANCNIYLKILECCCNKYTLIKWKEKATLTKSPLNKTIIIIVVIAIVTVLVVIIYFFIRKKSYL